MYDKYSYSDMQGYDIIDIVNALFLTTAYRVFKQNDIDENKIEEFEKYAEQDGIAFYSYFMHFVPDNEKLALDKLDKSSSNYIHDALNLHSDFQDSEAWKLAGEMESAASFLNFCLQIKGEPKYWEKVYKRLNLECETNDKYDNIYYEFRKEQPQYPPILLTSPKENIKIKKVKKEKKTSRPTIFSLYKTEILNLIFIAFFAFSIQVIFIRYIFFIFLLIFSVFLIIFSFREKLTTTKIAKFNLVKDILISIILLIGLIFQSIGVYSAIIGLALTIIEFVRSFIQKYISQKISTDT